MLFEIEFYNTFKDEYTPSCYLNLTRKRNNRKELVKLRIGKHKLLTETGRYDQIPRDNRLCPTCGSNQIEDEFHLLFQMNLQKNRKSNTKHNIITFYAIKPPKN